MIERDHDQTLTTPYPTYDSVKELRSRVQAAGMRSHLDVELETLLSDVDKMLLAVLQRL